jgi:hypothetical protein
VHPIISHLIENGASGFLTTHDLALSDLVLDRLQYGDRKTLENQAAAASAPVLIDRSVNQLQDIDGFRRRSRPWTW